MPNFRGVALSGWLLGTLLITGCAGTLPRDEAAEPAGREAAAAPAPAAVPARDTRDDSHDPLEGFNRAMYTFNDKLDIYVLKPVARGYRAVLPTPVRRSVSNFFANLREPVVILNNLLQGKLLQAASDVGRLLTNSTLGIAGLFDVATPLGMEKHSEDFGQTLGVWGVGEGPYLVLPFFGPSNIRDGFGLIADWEAYPPNHMEETSTRDKLLLVEIIDRRAQLLDASDILEQAGGKDPYVFVREAYRQRRKHLIYDGNPPAEAPDPMLFEDDEPANPDGKKKKMPAASPSAP